MSVLVGKKRQRVSGEGAIEAAPKRGFMMTGGVIAVSIPLCIILTALSPAYGVAGALVLLVLSLRLNIRTLALLLVIVSIFAPSIGDALDIGPLTYVDEIASLLLGVAVPVFLRLSGRHLVKLPGQWFLVLTLGLGLASSVLAGVSMTATLEGAFLLAKMPLLAFGLAQLGWSKSDVTIIARGIVQFLIPIVAFSVVVNLILGKRWVSFMSHGSGGYIDYRYGLFSSQGLFSHPLILGNVSAILAAGAFATVMHLPQVRLARAALLVAAVSALASFRRTAMLGLVAAIFLAWPKKARSTLIVGLCFLVPVLVVGLAADIQTTISTTLDEYVYTAAPAPRTRLLLGAFSVAAEHAPLGAGFTRYGSYLAGVDYSPEYVRLGFQHVWGLSNLPGMSGAFLTDTQWPVLIGETGWLGFAAFVAFLIALYRVFVRAERFDEPHLKWISTFGRGAFVVAAVASIGLPVFTSTPVASLLFATCGIGVSLVERAKRAGSGPVSNGPRALESASERAPR